MPRDRDDELPMGGASVESSNTGTRIITVYPYREQYLVRARRPGGGRYWYFGFDVTQFGGDCRT